MEFSDGLIDNGLINVERIKSLTLRRCRATGQPIESLNVGDYFLELEVAYAYSKSKEGTYVIYSDLSYINARLKGLETDLTQAIENLAQETEDRILGDEKLSTRIDDFQEEVDDITKGIQEQFDEIEETITKYVKEFTESLQEEKERVNTLVEEINEKIAKEVSTLNDTITNYVEILNSAIETEQTKRRTADEKLLETLTQEVEDRKTADTTLENTLKNDINTAVTDEREYVDKNILELKNKAGTSLSLTIDSNYIISAVLTSIDGTELSRETIDLPLEEFVVGGSYDEETKEVVLTLKNGDTIRFSIADLVDGLVNEKDFDETISKLTTEFKEDIDTLTTTLTTETEERKAADEELTQNLNSEITNRQNADSELETKITEEAQKRDDADTNLGNAINLESVAREQEDEELESAIDSLETKVDNNYDTLNTKLDTEIKERKEDIETLNTTLQYYDASETSLASLHFKILP